MYEVRTLFNIKFFETKDDVVNFYWSDFCYGSKYYENIRVLDSYTRQPIDIEVFLSLFQKKLTERKLFFAKRRYGNYIFRSGPVPHTGRRKWKGGMRYPRTKQELSQEKPTRAKRNHLPTTWDDPWRSTEKNWKSQRKTQYKVDF